MSKLTDEQIQEVVTAAVRERRLSWVGFKRDDQGAYNVPVLSPSNFQFAHAIEAAATEPLLQRIAELEQRNRDLYEDVQRFKEHALNEKAVRLELERQLEEARKDAERYRWLKERDRWASVMADFDRDWTYYRHRVVWYSKGEWLSSEGQSFEEAIDAAMQKGQS